MWLKFLINYFLNEVIYQVINYFLNEVIYQVINYFRNEVIYQGINYFLNEVLIVILITFLITTCLQVKLSGDLKELLFSALVIVIISLSQFFTCNSNIVSIINQDNQSKYS